MDCPKTFEDLYNQLFLIKDINEYIKQKWKGKDVQESLFRLFSYLELIDEFNDYYICKGNFNDKTIKPIKNLKDELYEIMKNNLKDKSDKSDLTLKRNKNLIITTSKNIKDGGIGNYDLRDLKCIVQDKYNKYDVRYCIVVKDKTELLNIVKNAEKCNEDLKDIILNEKNIIFDWNDIKEWYYKMMSLYPKDINELYKIKKPLLNLKFHQELSLIKTLELRKKYSQILWGHIPRSGKSYIMAGLISKLKGNNYLIITTSPNETISQYEKIFKTYQDFDDYNIITLTSKVKPQIKDKNIIICSKQFLQSKGTKDQEKTNIIIWLEKLIFDVRFIDESHNGGTTELAQRTLDLYGNNKNTLSIYITATYLKPLNDYKIDNESQVLWDLEDVYLCKNIKIKESQNKLKIKYGENVSKLLKVYNLDKIEKEYLKYPELQILTWDFKEEIKSVIKQELLNDSGFSLDSIFLLKNEKNTILSEFQNPEMVKELSWNIFGKYVVKNNIIMNDINYKSNFMNIVKSYVNSPKYNSRWFSKEKPLSILCFLPVGMENCPIDILSETYKKLLEKENILPNFNIVSINSKVNNGKNPKDIVDEAYEKTINDEKEGLLILSGKQLSLGVSIHHCDIVILMNNFSSLDTIYQMMFRSMTEDENKKCGFVIDLDLDRSINTIIDYSNKIYKNSNNTKENIKSILSQNLIGFNSHEWNKDIFGIKFNNIDDFISNVYKTYLSHPSKSIDKVLKMLDFKQDLFTKDDCNIINKMMDISGNSNNINKILDKLSEKDDKINNGIDNKSTDIDTESSSNSNNNKDKKVKEINIMKDIMKHLIPLLCLLTIHDEKSSSFDKLIEYIKDNKILKQILIEQIQTWWGKKFNGEILEVFLNLYNKRLKNNNDFNIICIKIKELFTANIGNQRELSKLIDTYLIPQDIEKKQNAEVSTPFELRQDMLSKIPIDFWKKKHKVFEPCSGKGGFLIDILNLFMKHLEGYDNNEDKYKTIVEECLYFSDINSTNIYLNKLLLDPFNMYKLNYNIGDTLEINIKSKWNIDGFDAVIGNPPYQASRKKENETRGGGGDLLWNKFVNYSIKNMKKNGYLLYVHPSGWRKPEGLDIKTTSKYKGMFDLMTKENQMLYLNINDTMKGLKIFGCGTRYDYYLLEKCKPYKSTIIVDEDEKEIIIDLKHIPFLPNKNILMIQNIISNNINKNIKVLRPGGDPRRDYISDNKNDEYKYTMIHSTPNSGVRYKYCNIMKETDHFNIKKIIFGETGINNNMILDKKGEFGITCCSFGIQVEKDFEKIKQALLSNKFKIFIESCQWSNYRIDWRLFTYLKNDFYKEFI